MCCLLSLYVVKLGNNEYQIYFLCFTEMLMNTILVYFTLTLSSYTCHVSKLETAREIYFEEQTRNRPYDFLTTLLYRFSICNTDNIKDFKDGNRNPLSRSQRGIMDIINPVRDFFGDGLVPVRYQLATSTLSSYYQYAT